MTVKAKEHLTDSYKRMVLRPEIYTRDEHPISRANIDPDALKIMYRLMRHGFKAYLVGGGVRDLLLNRRPKDFDVATDATPRQVKELFRNCRIIGRRFKLIHVFFRGNKIVEVSTFRDVSELVDPQEVESTEDLMITRDNTYGTEVTDALRRDITINGLFYDLSSFSIIDYVGGMRDIREGVIRIIGDPDIRFPEDPVRLTRMCRYAAKADFKIDPKCFESLQRNAALIRKSAPMRVFEELKKDFTSGYALKTLRLFAEAGLLEHLLPELAANNAALLDDECDFAKVLARSDEIVLEGTPRSPTVVLALILIFSRSPVLEGLAEQIAGASEISEITASGMPLLAVPRKEREKLETLLGAWHSLLTTGSSRMEVRNLGRIDLLQDFSMLIRVLYGEGPELEMLEELRTPAPANEQGRSHRQPADQRPHRRRRRGPRGRGRHQPHFT